MQTPILFIVFNRPAVTNKVFEHIRTVSPSRVYVAVDGPREDRHVEKDLCNEVRKIVANVDSPYEVKTLFRDRSFGCRVGVQTALDWYFEHTNEGIILEDDCLPNIDFSRYCAWALDVYRDDKKVWHINGNNFLAPISLY